MFKKMMYTPIETDNVEIQYDNSYGSTSSSSPSSSLLSPSLSLKDKINRYRIVSLTAIIFSVSLIIMTITSYSNSMRATLNRVTAFKQVFHSEIPTVYWGTVTKPYPTGAFWYYYYYHIIIIYHY